jgi:hypothetical protein
MLAPRELPCMTLRVTCFGWSRLDVAKHHTFYVCANVHSSYNAKSIWNRGNFGSIKPAVKCIAYVCFQPRRKTNFVHKGLWFSVGVSAAANCLIWNLLGESWVQKFLACHRKHFCWGPNLKLGCNSLPHFSTDNPSCYFRRVSPHALSQTFVSF